MDGRDEQATNDLTLKSFALFNYTGGGGLAWFSPVSPMRGADMKRQFDLVRQVMDRHGVDFMVGVAFGERAALNVMPIAFDRGDAEWMQRVHDCYGELVDEVTAAGFGIYRRRSGGWTKSPRASAKPISRSIRGSSGRSIPRASSHRANRGSGYEPPCRNSGRWELSGLWRHHFRRSGRGPGAATRNARAYLGLVLQLLPRWADERTDLVRTWSARAGDNCHRASWGERNASLSPERHRRCRFAGPRPMDRAAPGTRGATTAMRISRRNFIGAGLAAAELAHCPVLAAALARSHQPVIVIADPAVLLAPPPLGALTASGSELLRALLPILDSWQRIEAVLREADLQMLAELVRFEPSMRWASARLPANCETIAGRLGHPACVSVATRMYQGEISVSARHGRAAA